jgi:hypothetical protein
MKEEEQPRRNSPELEQGDEAAVSLLSKIQSPPGISGRGAAEAARKVKVLNVGKQWRRRAGGRRRRSFFSVPRSGGGAQGTREQRNKKALWGVKRASLPSSPYLYRRTEVMGIAVVIHYSDHFCGDSPRSSAEWGGGSCNRATRP